MIWRALVTCAALIFASWPATDPERILKTDAHVAAHRGRHGGDRHLVAAGAQHRPAIVLAPEQPVGGAPHVDHVLRMRADAAKDAEHRLHEERRLDHAAVGEVRERVEMADVIALDLEARAVLGAGGEDVFDIGEGVLEDALARSFEIGLLPVVLELLVAGEHRKEPEIHRTHVEARDLRLEGGGGAHALFDSHRRSAARRDVHDRSPSAA